MSDQRHAQSGKYAKDAHKFVVFKGLLLTNPTTLAQVAAQYHTPTPRERGRANERTRRVTRNAYALKLHALKVHTHTHAECTHTSITTHARISCTGGNTRWLGAAPAAERRPVQGQAIVHQDPQVPPCLLHTRRQAQKHTQTHTQAHMVACGKALCSLDSGRSLSADVAFAGVTAGARAP